MANITTAYAGLYSAANFKAPYIRYDVMEDYEYNDGSIAIPVAYNTGVTQQAGGRTAQEIVPVSAPFSRRIVRFMIERQNALPVAPAPTPLNANENLSRSVVRTFNPTINPGGGSITTRMVGVYIFDHRQPVIPGVDTIRTPTTDADKLTNDQVSVGPGQFRTGLI